MRSVKILRCDHIQNRRDLGKKKPVVREEPFVSMFVWCDSQGSFSVSHRQNKEGPITLQ